jgi:hypothetical protein
MKIHTIVMRFEQLRPHKVVRAFYLVSFALLTLSFSQQTFAQEKSEEDQVSTSYRAIAAEIADARMREAVQSH